MLQLTRLGVCPHDIGMTIRLSLAVGLLLSLSVPNRAADVVGKALLPWKPGSLDIHQISTGRGNAGLYIFPDGTTLLVDAGEMPTKTAAHTPDRPNATRFTTGVLRRASASWCSGSTPRSAKSALSETGVSKRMVMRP